MANIESKTIQFENIVYLLVCFKTLLNFYLLGNKSYNILATKSVLNFSVPTLEYNLLHVSKIDQSLSVLSLNKYNCHPIHKQSLSL